MRKLIRHAAVAVFAWAVVTFAWAALSHTTGAIGPAQASSASLEFVADAIEFLSPPALLAGPQDFTARRIRAAAHNAEHLHQGPERVMARLLDRMGHASAHRGDRRRHKHVRRTRSESNGNVVIHLDSQDHSSDQWRRRAQIEVERHSSRLDRNRERAERDRERAERQVERVQRLRERRQEMRERSSRRVDRIERIPVGEINEVASQIAAEFMQLEQLGADISDEDRDKLKRKGLEKLREILEGLGDEMGNLTIDLQADFEGLELEGMELQNLDIGDLDFDGDFDFFFEKSDGADSPVSIRIHRDR